jgi:two-component system, LytTR family, response regulator
VDDELGARESLANMVKRYCPNVDIVAKADSVKTAAEAIAQHAPDLVFLDIEMPNGNAFDLLEKYDQIDFDIIFTTAYDNHAIQAIRFSAIDYLLKPVDPEELKMAVQRFEKRPLNAKKPDEQYKTLLTNLKPGSKFKKIGIPDGEGLQFINLSDIIRCYSESNYTFFVLTNGSKILASRTLGEYEQLFANENFYRVHRSHLINLDHIKRYIRGEGGYVIMSDDSQVEVSRRNKTEFLDKIGHI